HAFLWVIKLLQGGQKRLDMFSRVSNRNEHCHIARFRRRAVEDAAIEAAVDLVLLQLIAPRQPVAREIKSPLEGVPTGFDARPGPPGASPVMAGKRSAGRF